MNSDTSPPIPEQQLADSFGVPRGLLSGARKPGGLLVEGTHWQRESSGRVVYLSAGVAAARAVLGLPPEPEKKEGGPPAPAALIVARHTKNPRILEARTHEGRIVRVRIKANTHRRYPIGTPIDASPIGDPQQGLFEIQHRRHALVTPSPQPPKSAPLNLLQFLNQGNETQDPNQNHTP